MSYIQSPTSSIAKESRRRNLQRIGRNTSIIVFHVLSPMKSSGFWWILVDFAWIFHGLFMDFSWIVHGLFMDFVWILCGFGSFQSAFSPASSTPPWKSPPHRGPGRLQGEVAAGRDLGSGRHKKNMPERWDENMNLGDLMWYLLW